MRFSRIILEKGLVMEPQAVEKPVKKKRCDYCKEWFTPTRPWMKFCNDKCRNGFHNDERDIEREKERNK